MESENTEKQNKFIYYLAHDIHGKLHPGVQRKEKPWVMMNNIKTSCAD